jgi:transposase
VDNWWAKWQAGGREALLARAKGRPVGVHQVLGEAEQAAVRQAVLDHRPCDVGLVGQLWTRCLVGDLIAKLDRMRLTGPGVGKYLKRWGLSFHRPDKRAVDQDPKAVARWHEESWPTIRARAKAEGGEVLFADQVGIRSDQVTGRTWGLKGVTPIVRRTGNRFSVYAMSAISTKARMYFMVFPGTFDSAVMCRFLQRLVGHFDHKIHLVVDGHSAHRSKKVRDWLADHAEEIELHFLPPYSPELNPDELVNADLKHNLPKSHRARNQAELASWLEGGEGGAEGYLDGTWDGHAADATYVYFDELAQKIAALDADLTELQGYYQDMGLAINTAVALVKGLLTQLADEALILEIELAAGTALAETGVGMVAMYALAALEIAAIIKTWGRLTEAYSAADQALSVATVAAGRRSAGSAWHCRAFLSLGRVTTMGVAPPGGRSLIRR